MEGQQQWRQEELGQLWRQRRVGRAAAQPQPEHGEAPEEAGRAGGSVGAGVAQPALPGRQRIRTDLILALRNACDDSTFDFSSESSLDSACYS